MEIIVVLCSILYILSIFFFMSFFEKVGFAHGYAYIWPIIIVIHFTFRMGDKFGEKCKKYFD